MFLPGAISSHTDKLRSTLGCCAAWLILAFSLHPPVASCQETSNEEASAPVSVPPGVNPAAFPQPKAENWLRAHEKLTKRVEVNDCPLLFVGDSITQHWLTQDRGREIWNARYKPLKAINIGKAGDRTENVLWRLQHGGLGKVQPKVTVLPHRDQQYEVAHADPNRRRDRSGRQRTTCGSAANQDPAPGRFPQRRSQRPQASGHQGNQPAHCGSGRREVGLFSRHQRGISGSLRQPEGRRHGGWAPPFPRGIRHLG